MTIRRTRVAINGFGRIGRTLTRLILDHPELELIAINDIVDDASNLVYLYNYDSTHGFSKYRASLSSPCTIAFENANSCRYTSCSHIEDPDWTDVDILIDSSGVSLSKLSISRLRTSSYPKKIVVTNATNSEYIDFHTIFGVNHELYNSSDHYIVASNICDANAVAHPMEWLDSEFGIDAGFITTLHPWLSYQNLVDSPIPSQGTPGTFWCDYSLGRSSINTLIPKNTTLVSALSLVLPNVSSRLEAFSYRTPTSIVSSADISVLLRRSASLSELTSFLSDMSERSPFTAINLQPLVGIDYRSSEQSAIIDLQWCRLAGSLFKFVLWYDNEWGYSSRVRDLVVFIGGHL